MREKIKRIVKLPDSSSGPNGSKINWYHIYFQEPGFGQEPKGAMVEERATEMGSSYYVKPLGFMNSANVIFATPSLHNQRNEARDFFDWVNQLSQTEIGNLVHGRELLKG